MDGGVPAAHRPLDAALLARARARGPRPLALWLVLFAVYAAGAGMHARAGSDLRPSEAHVLLTTQSLVHDGDYVLDDDYAHGSWAPFYRGRLVPSALSVDGRLIEPQGLGFPAVLVPAYAIGGRLAVELFLAALAALGFVLAAALARRVVPEPWATRAALAAGLSPPAVVAATTIAPAALVAALLAGAALMALRVRKGAAGRAAAASAAMLALIPWLGPVGLLPAVVVAGALYVWMRRVLRGWAAFGAMEIVLLSVIVYVTLNRHLFGGLTPYAASALAHAPSGIGGLGDLLSRWPRLLGVWVDPQVGLLLYAPVTALAGVALGHAWRLRRERVARAFPAEADAERATQLLALVCAAGVLTALLLPSLAGRGPGEPLVVVLPCLAALAAAALRRVPRTGGALALAGVVLTLWMLVAVRIDDHAGVSPVRGAVPWSTLAGDSPPRVR